jgi:uncharacterized lipoprotein YbaY
MPRVSVQLDWPAGVTAVPADARAVVTVEDVSRADAASTVVASTELTDLDVSRPAVAEVDVPDVDPSANLVVRVHVTASAEGTRDVSLGDLITTRSHPVLTRGHGDSVVVPLTRVGG